MSILWLPGYHEGFRVKYRNQTRLIKLNSMTCQKDWDHVVRKTSSSWWQKWKHCDWRKPTKPARKRENPGDTAGALDPALPENCAEMSVIWVHRFSLPSPFWVWISAVCISKKLHLYSWYTHTPLLDPHYSGFPGEIFRLETLKLLRLHILPAYWFQETTGETQERDWGRCF